jgi:hypothetical protein
VNDKPLEGSDKEAVRDVGGISYPERLVTENSLLIMAFII